MINLLSDINECDANPCQNNGTCYNTMGSFTCTCATGYDGDTCQNGKELKLFGISVDFRSRIHTALFFKLIMGKDRGTCLFKWNRNTT